MGFRDDQPVIAPMALPEGFDLNPEEAESDVGIFGAAMRRENPIASKLNSFSFDEDAPFDPSYRAYDDIQGTIYEGFSDRFVEARNADQSAMMKAQIDRELEDRRALDAAGPLGIVSEMGAALLSPSSLLPGGAVVRGAKGGVKVGRSALSVSASAGVAAALDELALQNSQETREGVESGLAIGGSVILGGFLGGAVASLSRSAHLRASASTALVSEDIVGFNDGLRSIGAAEVPRDVSLRREELFQFFNKSQFRVEQALSKVLPDRVASVVASPLAVLRPIVRSDPILRAMLSDNIAARRALPELVETPLQYRINEEGRTVLDGEVSVERAIETRRNTELAKSLGSLSRSFAEYVNDGPVGTVGRLTAPVTGVYQHLVSKGEKLSRKEFMEEVGIAAMSGDQHPIPQVAKAAQDVRKEIFEKARLDAIEVGIFDEDLQLKFADSYFMRSYNVEKIAQHLGDGSENDMSAVLRREFQNNRQAAIQRLENDDTVERAQAKLAQSREALTQSRRSLNKATRKARGKRDRAKASVAREERVLGVTGALRRHFKARQEKLEDGLMQGEELAEFKEMLATVRGVKKLEPVSILPAIRALGGIKDPRSNNLWRNGDWVSDGTPTDIEVALDKSAISIRRNKGLQLDMMREALTEAGYLREGSTEADLLDAIAREGKGEKVYSEVDAEDVVRYEAALELVEEFDRMGIDTSKPVNQIIQSLEGKARSQKITKAKAGEAGRAAKKAGKSGGMETMLAALRRLDEANARLAELKELAPAYKEEQKALRKEIGEDMNALQKAKDARGADEFYANKDDLEIQEHVDSAIASITGMKVGEHSISPSLSDPTKARVLDVHDKNLLPWLEKDMGIVMAQYFNSIVPDIEMARRFGKDGFAESKQRILDVGARTAKKATTARQKTLAIEEAEERVRELDQMAQRITGRFGVPDNPKDIWVRGSRFGRTLSYMGYLGGMTISAIPDVAGLIGRNGIEAAFGMTTALTDPKRLFSAVEDAVEMDAAAEWYLNARAISIADIADQYGANSKIERGMGQAANAFGVATGMIPWNAGWKSLGGAFISSKMSKAAVATKAGKATKKDMLALSANGIEPWMAIRIADQIEKHGDTDGRLWLPQGRLWDDEDAFKAFQNGMNRELNLMVVTPGQDKPIGFSTPAGAFFFQFKSFGVAAHHRIMLAGLQRSDAEVLAQVTTAMVLGRLVSNIKAWQNGDQPKEGAAAWEDAIDRAGIAGWLVEAQGMTNALSGGNFSISGEKASRFATRSELEGLLGPTVDMAKGAGESVAAYGRGSVSENDARQLLRPIPGNNLPYLLGLTDQVSKAMSEVMSN